jgi:RimJ/RimL family protein N-acetyltransferase
MKARRLETRRLNLEPLSDGFVTERYVGWLNDAHLMRFSEQRHQRHTLESCRTYVASFKGSPNFIWAIVNKNPALGHVGNISAHIDVENSLADVGILIGEKSVRGQRIGLEAWNEVCRHLLDDLGIRKVTAGTIADNKAMIRIMQLAEMQHDGHRTRHYVVDGKEVDIVYACLFRQQQREGLDH